MFDLVHKHKRIMQIVLLLLIIPPFAFWGIQSYEGVRAGGGEVADVGGQKITEQELSVQLRQQQDRLRAMFGGKLDPAAFDTPEAREQLLEGMVSQRLLTQDVVRKRLVATDDNLRETIGSIPAFQENGKFSRPRYQQAVQAEGYSVPAFESNLRRDLMVQQLASAVGDAGIVSRAVAREWAALAGEQREIARATVPASSFTSQVKSSPEAIQAFYEANRKDFEVPEQARVEYVVLNRDSLLAADPVSPDEIKAQYEANRAQYEQKEQRQASHILLTVKPGSSADEKAKVKARAAEIAAQVKKNPATFADAAKKQSEDPGSAGRGGDLGFFSRGMMVPAFEDAVFSMKPGEVSDPVESDFGFHVIRMTAVRPGKVKPLEEVRAVIEADLRKQRAGRRFAEAADQFANMVYEQPDSLKPVVDKFKLRVESAGWMLRGEAKPPLNHPKLQQAIFSDDAIKNGRNTEAVEVSPGTMVAARVAEHRPASVKPLDEVRGDVVKEMVRRESAKLAWKQGAEKLEQLKKGEAAGVTFSASRTLGREGSQDAPANLVSAAFKADRSKLPAYVGVEQPDGYQIVRVSKIVHVPLDETREKGAQAELGRITGGSQLQAYISALRADTKVTVNKSALKKKEE
jgi:peptidyl-prolyl cis-trans isomerase D